MLPQRIDSGKSDDSSSENDDSASMATLNGRDVVVIEIKDFEALEERVARIEERNRRVELDKAFETSYTRRIIVTLITYGIVLAFLISIKSPKPYLIALIPTGAYVLSNLSVGKRVKKCWKKCLNC